MYIQSLILPVLLKSNIQGESRVQEQDKEKREFGDLVAEQAQNPDQSTILDPEKQPQLEGEDSETTQPSVEIESEELKTVKSPLILAENAEVPLTDTSKWDFTELEKVMEKQKKDETKVSSTSEMETLNVQDQSQENDSLSTEKGQTESNPEESLATEGVKKESNTEETSTEKVKEEPLVVDTGKEDNFQTVEATQPSIINTKSDHQKNDGELSVSQHIEKSFISEIKKDEKVDKSNKSSSSSSDKEEMEDSFLLHLHQETRSTNSNSEHYPISAEASPTEAALIGAAVNENIPSSNQDIEPSTVQVSHVDKNKTKKWFVGALAFLFVSGGVYLWATQDKIHNPTHAIMPEEKQEPQKIMLTASGKSFELDLLTIGYDGKDPETVDQTKLLAWLDEVKKQVDIPMKNASQKKVDEPITPEQAGSVVDVKAVKEWLSNIKTIMNQPKELPLLTIEPQVTTEDLRAASKKLVGSYRTTFDAGNVNRTINIKLASKAIDGLVLLPGQNFSFNKVVGERTAARGYKSAAVIVKGEYSEGIGGGICQVSSTLFNSVDEANLKITRRISHSKEVTYVPPGRDATVSWGGPDFRFRNNYNKPIVIRIIVQGGTLTVKTYTVPGAEKAKKKIQPPPTEKFSQITVDGTKPNEILPDQPTTP